LWHQCRPCIQDSGANAAALWAQLPLGLRGHTGWPDRDSGLPTRSYPLDEIARAKPLPTEWGWDIVDPTAATEALF
jgi:hypothetical protein